MKRNIQIYLPWPPWVSSSRINVQAGLLKWNFWIKSIIETLRYNRDLQRSRKMCSVFWLLSAGMSSFHHWWTDLQSMEEKSPWSFLYYSLYHMLSSLLHTDHHLARDLFFSHRQILHCDLNKLISTSINTEHAMDTSFFVQSWECIVYTSHTDTRKWKT